MKKIFGISAAIVLVAAGCDSSAPAVQPYAQFPSRQTNNQTIEHPVVTYSANGIKFAYPTDIFTAVSLKNGTTLRSKYYVDISQRENFLNWQYFQISMEIIPGSIPAVAKKTQTIFANQFPGGSILKFQPSKGFAETTMVAGNPGFVFHEGLEGNNDDFIFVQKSQKQTLRISLSYFDPSVLGGPLQEHENISMQEQQTVYKQVADTLAFTE